MIMPPQAISFVSAILFLAFGIYMILTRNKEECFRENNSKSAFLSIFSLITLMELGDKTQITVISLAAKYSAPMMVYVGVIMAFIVLTGLGVLLGRAFSKWLPLKYIKLGSGLILLLFGMFFFFEFLKNV
ncbi:MAG: TMEM165/GDT1 family protein [Thermoproteota archaeon]